MLRVLVSVLAAASFTQAFDPSTYINEISSAIKEKLHDGKQLVNEKVHIPRIIRNKDIAEDSMPHFGRTRADNHTCAECTRWVGHHLVQASINETISYCKHTDCPEAKKHCKWAKEHKEFTVGYITQRVQPQRSGQLFCEGKGVCPIHNCGNTIELMNEDNLFMNQNAALDAITAALDSPSDNEDSKIELAASSSSSDEIITPFNDFDGDGDDEDDINIDYILKDTTIEKGKLCGKCISAVTTHIIKGNLVQVAAFCAKQKDAKWKARCDFTLSHPDFSSGYLFSKYKPANTGYGYCYAKGACAHSPNAFSQNVQPAQIFDINF